MEALAGVTNWPVGVVAAGVVARSAADPRRPRVADTIGPTDRPFLWASVTKLCTALAVLVAVEEGTISFETPVGPPGATVAHLLAHASGIGPTKTQILAPPGTRRIYSNAGFDLLGQLVAARSSMSFSSYLTASVLDPLGMTQARLGGDASPAYGMSGTVNDLLALGRECLAPTLVAPETLTKATTVAFPGLVGVLPGFGRQDPCDWGLGFELRNGKHPHWTGQENSPWTFGHFGRAGGFLWVDPVPGLACVVLTDQPFGPWAHEAWPTLSDAVLAEFSPH